jgi:hypothetical protein
MIREISRGSIVFQIGQMTITVEGEMLAGEGQNSNFVVYSDSIRKWDPPNENVPLDESAKRMILKSLLDEMRSKNWIVEIDDTNLDLHYAHMARLRVSAVENKRRGSKGIFLELPYWFGIVMRKLPDHFKEGIVLADGFATHAELETGDMLYAILARTVADSTVEGESFVREAIERFGPIEVRLVADDVTHVIRPERSLAKSLKRSDVQLKNAFVGFKADSLQAQATAMQLVEDAVLRKWWQFWR